MLIKSDPKINRRVGKELTLGCLVSSIRYNTFKDCDLPFAVQVTYLAPLMEMSDFSLSSAKKFALMY